MSRLRGGLGRLRTWRRWTLRARLGVALVALAGLALMAANAAGVILLRGYLTDKIDAQLTGMGRRFAEPAPTGGTRIGPLPQPGRAIGPGFLVIVYDAHGILVDQGRSRTDLSPPRLDPPAKLIGRAGANPFTVPAADAGSAWRVRVVNRTDGGVAVLAASLRDVDATADKLLAIDAGMMFVVLVGVGLLTTGVVGLGLRPLTRMEEIAAAVTVGDLDRRVTDVDPHTEPGRLGAALNVMLHRIGSEMAARAASEGRLRQFLADASHELRTPLTSIRGFAELYRRGGAPAGPALDDTMRRIEEEAERMSGLVDDLLLLARLDRERPPRSAPVDLLGVAADVVGDAHARRPDRSVRLLGVDGELSPVAARGDEHRIRQIATNLLANALQHTPAEAQVTVRVGWLDPAAARLVAADWPADRPAALLEVADTGPGIPTEQVDRIFERLYRVEASRVRAFGGGAGLGLAIVAAIVAQHDGRVSVDTGTGTGATFRILLPVDDLRSHRAAAGQVAGDDLVGVESVASQDRAERPGPA